MNPPQRLHLRRPPGETHAQLMRWENRGPHIVSRYQCFQESPGCLGAEDFGINKMLCNFLPFQMTHNDWWDCYVCGNPYKNHQKVLTLTITPFNLELLLSPMATIIQWSFKIIICKLPHLLMKAIAKNSGLDHWSES